MEGESILGIVYNAEGQVGRMALPKMYDLIFTDRRLVGAVTAKTGAAALAGGLLGGAIGGVIAGAVAKRGAEDKRSRYANLPLDTIIASDKANFTVPYGRIENPQIKGLFTKSLRLRIEGKKAFFKLPKIQLQQARALVSSRLPGSKV